MKIIKVLFIFFGLSLAVENTQAQFWQPSAVYGFDTVYSIAVHPNDSIFITTSDSAVYSSADYGGTFVQMPLGLDKLKIFSISIAAGKYIFAGTDSGGVYRSIDNGNNWSFISPIMNAYALFTNSSNHLFAGTDNGEIYRSSDYGNSWQLIGSTNYWKVTSFAQNPSYMFCGTMGGGIFRSNDNGNNWVQIVSTTPQIFNVNAIHINKRNEIFAATSNNGIFKSTDNGATWVQINNGITTLNVTSLISNGQGDLFAGTYGNGVFRSNDYGASWSAITSGMAPGSVVRSLAVDSLGFIYAGSQNVVYRSVFPSELPAPNLVSPIANDDSVSASPLMIWNNVLSATGYTLQISKDPAFATITIETSSLVDTSYLASGLEYKTQYYWRVQATNPSAISNWSVVRGFKTAIASPDIPVLLLPANNASSVPESPTFLWKSSPRAAKYWFQLSLNRNFTVLTREDTTITDTTYIYGPLTNNTKFFWRVRAKNTGWTSDWSSVDSFTTIIPIPVTPTPLSPAFGEGDVPISTNFRWTRSPYAATYRLQISTDPGFSTFFYNDSTLTDTTAAIDTMMNSATYYWRVNAKNSAGISNFSISYHFTTIITAPATPLLVSPNNADSNLTTSPVLKCNIANGALQYQFFVSRDSLFSTIINDTTWINDTTCTLNTLSNGIKYYWRVRAKNPVGYSSWSAFRSFKTFSNAPVPQWWSFSTNTGNNSSISIPISINPTIGTNRIKNGDAIGVFFLRNDSMFCAGSTIWNYSANNGIIIWGDNSQTQIKDGFAQGELIRFKIWDSQTKKEYPAQVKFSGGMTNYFMNEYLTVDSLKGTTKITHSIQLHQGWNLISTYAQPQDSTMDSVCLGIRPSMVLIKDGLGRFYWPDFNIHQIAFFNFRQGYQIYMLAPATWTFTGTNVIWDTTKIKVIPGWNMISYLRQSPMRIDSALSKILGKVVLVKNDSGQFFWNEFGINTIGSMKAGIGYQIYMSDSATFNYPYGLVPLNLLSKKQYAELKQLSKPVFYKLNSQSSSNTAMAMFESSGLRDGDEVGIFTYDGKLTGSAVADGGKAFLTIYGDEEITKDIIEGAKENEELFIKIKSKANGKEQPIKNISVINALSNNEKSNQIFYRTNSILKISENQLSTIPQKFTLEQNYPNPFNPVTIIKFSLPNKTRVTFDVYNTLGQLVKREIDNMEMNEGIHQIEFDGNKLASGIYYYRIKTEKNSETKKMLLLR